MASLGDERGHLQWVYWCSAVVITLRSQRRVIVLGKCPSSGNLDESMGKAKLFWVVSCF